ncbi:hypothetical protein [Pectobacterium phage Zenivior_B1]|uniref:Uncharacterized protein n=2 Tax=Phimunavirus zenivior TaxID=2733345 RepID=A0A3G8FJN9_9CAUD|nr:hypothetical protein HOU75_gp32 [Pectobacterium phage Zenivior]AZF94993.1 hypothetical protein [Pectobacterium phage Zenivior]AZF95048.1 hypothetical protein [Pectobacterium phage Zenivior_B1]
MTKQHIGFSVVLTTTNQDDVQKLAQLMQIFADQSSTTTAILVSKAHAWTVQNAGQAANDD